MQLRPIQPGSPSFRRFEEVLAEANLPTGDLLADPASYYAVEDAGEPSAFGGLSLLGEHALLRSIVVRPIARGAGQGKAIVAALAEMAGAKGARQLWLLTTTAEGFFSHQGWEVVDRRHTPAPIAATYQFASTCPASAVLMCRKLP
jgi:amino-acid N-acetyltransferase